MKTSTNRYQDNTNTTRIGQYVKAPPVQRLTPSARTIGRDWAQVDLRSVTSGNTLGLFGSIENIRKLSVRDTTKAGKPEINPVLLTLLTVTGVVLGLSTRKLQGYTQGLFKLAGVDPSLVPDHVSISRFWDKIDYGLLKEFISIVQSQPDPVVYVAVDATGISVTKSGGWVADKPGNKDKRRGKYRKLHTAVNITTGEILVYELTGSDGAGSGDGSVGPNLVEGLPDTTKVVCADGAYTGQHMFEVTDDLGVTLLVPLRQNSKYGRSKSRNQLLTQQSRIGRGTWKKRSGYHQRSQVESVYATLDRLVGNRVSTRTLGRNQIEMDIKVLWYNRSRAISKM